MILSDSVLEVIRRELRRLTPGIRIETDDIQRSLLEQVLKREVVEGEKFQDARRKIGRAQTRALLTR